MKISKLFYKYIALSFFFFLLGSSSAQAQTGIPAKAALANSINQQTTQQVANSGDNVKLQQAQQQKTETKVDNVNTSTTNQSTTVNANTGNNSADRNISIGGNAGVIQTGNIGVVTNAQATGNTNTTAVASPGPTGAGGSSTHAVNTGNNVNTSSNTSNTNTTNVQNTNNSNTTQSTTVNANTGNNHADRNIAIGGGSVGVIQTGGVGVQANYLVSQNGNATLVGGSNTNGNGPGSGASIFLTNSGDGVNATSSANNTNSTSVNNLNNTYLTQLATVNANTGNNTADRNISIGGDAGVIKTGAVLVDTSYSASGGNNNTAVATGSGPSGNGNPGSNTSLTNSGDNVRTDTNTSSDTSTSVNNTNNTFLTQSAFINSNTGGNTSNRNLNIGGDAGTIQTGNVGVSVNFLADFSRNKTLIYPTTTNNNYTYLPPRTQYITLPATEPTQQVTQPVVNNSPTRDQVYYYYVYPTIKSRYASYVASNPSVLGTNSQDFPTSDAKAQLAVQESQQGAMTVSGISQIMVMLISLGALALRKVIRV